MADTSKLVLMNFGWYGKFVLPVKAAAEIMNQLVSSGAVKVENEHVEGLSQSFLRPTKAEWGVQPLDALYIDDCPMDQDERKPYLDWLKTKAQLIGKSYQPESYAAYLEAKG